MQLKSSTIHWSTNLMCKWKIQMEFLALKKNSLFMTLHNYAITFKMWQICKAIYQHIHIKFLFKESSGQTGKTFNSKKRFLMDAKHTDINQRSMFFVKQNQLNKWLPRMSFFINTLHSPVYAVISFNWDFQYQNGRWCEITLTFIFVTSEKN